MKFVVNIEEDDIIYMCEEVSVRADIINKLNGSEGCDNSILQVCDASAAVLEPASLNSELVDTAARLVGFS